MAAVDLKKVRKEILAAVGLERDKGEEEQTFLARVVKAVTKLPDPKWEALSVEAQDWQNDNIDRLNDKKKPPILGFGDDEQDDDDAPPARRGRREAAEAAEPEGPVDPEAGDTVTLTLSNGEKVKGEVIEIDEKNVVLEVDGEEEVYRRSKVAVIKVHSSSAAATAAPPKEPTVGDEVLVTLVGGKKVTGEIVEIDEKNVVLEVDGEEEPFRRAKVESIVPAAAATTSRRSVEPDAAAANAAPARRGRGRPPAATSTRAVAGDDGETDVKKAWKLMSEHMGDTFEQAQKRVAKAGLTVKEGTLNIRYKDLQHTYERFKELGLIK